MTMTSFTNHNLVLPVAVAVTLALLSATLALAHPVSGQSDAASCANGSAVPDSANNPSLVSDCETLLEARETLAGTATLNWSENTSISDWDGVTVGGTPERVTELVLKDKQLTGQIPSSLNRLASVEKLDLSQNELSGDVPPELGDLANLEELWLWRNQLTGTIPIQLAQLSSLTTLNIHTNQLTGTIPKELGSLANLERLSLTNNQLTGTVPPELGNLSKLELLILGTNELTGTLPSELGKLVNLETLSLGRNRLTGIPVELGSITNLRFLLLNDNQMTGTIPDELGGLTNLVFLWMQNNQFTGGVPTWLGSLASLESIGLSQNQLMGEIPSDLGNLSDLRQLYLSQNQLTGPIPALLGDLMNLQRLFLSGNELTGCIPDGLRDVGDDRPDNDPDNDLADLGLPDCAEWAALAALYNATDGANWKNNANWLSDRPVGEWHGVTTDNSGRVTALGLSDNGLTGGIPPELGTLSNLQWLVLSVNQLSGPIPTELGGLSNLLHLSLARNQLTGSIPAELGGLSSLQYLALSDNELAGPIPASLGRLTELDQLYLHSNKLAGEIPAELGNLNNLEWLYLSDNQLSGPIPTSLGSLSNLEALSLSQNQLTGPIPPELRNLAYLQRLFLSGNELTGCIPRGLRDVADDNADNDPDNDLADLGLPDCVSLTGLTISPGELTPPFNPDHTDYTAIVGAARVTVTVTHDDDTTQQFLDENDVEIQDADTTLEGHQVDLEPGVTTIKVRVTSRDGRATETYTVEVIRANVPGAPAISAVTPFGGYLEVSWTAPGETGGVAVSDYDLRYIESAAADKADANWIVVEGVWSAGAGGDLKYAITGLTSGIEYDVQVRAVNVTGMGPWSATVAGTPETPSTCVSGGAVPDATNTGLVSDCEMLLAAADDLAGTATLNWSEDTAMAQWDGVRFGGTPRRVSRLLLPGKGLGGTIPAELGRLTMLTDLNLRTNGLSGTIPAELGNLTNLVRLNLHTNQLAGPIPDLSRITGLAELYLARNMLTGPVPEWLDGMTEMRELWIWGNELSGTIPDLSGMTSLEKLKLAGNNLEGGVPEASALPANLRWLIIQENPLGGTIPDLSGMTRLTVLWLHTNGLAGEIPASHLPSSVTSVNLHTNQLSGKIPDLSGLDNLQWLRLQSNQLSGMIPSTLGDMDSLTRLWLHNNMLSGSIPAWFGRLSKLERLWLSDNMLSGQIPEQLGELGDHSLVEWRLSGNDLTGCVPAGLADVADNDLDQIGLQVCTSGLVTLAGSPVSQTQVQVTWSLSVDDITELLLYRDGTLMATPSVETLAYEDQGLNPNTRYWYQIVAKRQDGTYAADGFAVATLAYRPKTSDQVATTWTGLQQPIVDELNPDHTEYRITLTRDDGLRAISDWSTSKCRTFNDLEQGSFYRISVIARNLDGVETEQADQRAGEHGRDVSFFPPHVFTWRYAGTEDPWVADRIRDTALIFGLTDAAAEWMNNDILIEWRRGEPGWAGHLRGYVGIGHSFLGTLMHEAMHAFWQFWDGFREPCDQMNFYTFRRDVAEFVLDFREYDQSGSDNPLEPWRIYYNMIVGLMTREQGEDFWSALERGEYGKFLGVYHLMETSMPGYSPRHISLIPPRLRKYVHGFMKEGESRTWEEEIDWYSRLAGEDQDLWEPFITHEVAYYSPEAHAPPTAERTRIPEPQRSALRETHRRKLVDFINTLEDQVPWEWRDRSPGFWSFFVRQHIYKMTLYGGELNSSIGVELEPPISAA